MRFSYQNNRRESTFLQISPLQSHTTTTTSIVITITRTTTKSVSQNYKSQTSGLNLNSIYFPFQAPLFYCSYSTNDDCYMRVQLANNNCVLRQAEARRKDKTHTQQEQYRQIRRKKRQIKETLHHRHQEYQQTKRTNKEMNEESKWDITITSWNPCITNNQSEAPPHINLNCFDFSHCIWGYSREKCVCVCAFFVWCIFREEPSGRTTEYTIY